MYLVYHRLIKNHDKGNLMIIQCEGCSKKFIVKDSDIPSKGRDVQCGYCSSTWFQKPISNSEKILKLTKIDKSPIKKTESLSVDFRRLLPIATRSPRAALGTSRNSRCTG